MIVHLKPADPKQIIDSIHKEAVYKWGRHWLADLVHRYCEVEGEATGTTPPFTSRRPTIGRVFETGKITVQTLQWLAVCVNAKLQLIVTVDKQLKTFEDIISGIQQSAIAIWGEEWFVCLVRSYCQVEGQVTGKTPLAKPRRSTIERVFQVQQTTLETATWLAAAVGAEIQMEFQRIEVKKF